MKKFSLAAQFLSPAFAAAIASPSSVSVAEVAAKKYDTHRDIDIDAATSRASRNLDSIDATPSKCGKSSSYCPPEPTQDVQCGNVYNSTDSDEEVVVILGGNLLCDENITDADDSRNAALTLVGEKSVLNCQGYTISQTTVNIDGIDKGSAAALDCPITPEAAGNSTELLRIKQECGLFFEVGVLLRDGASMVNCNIQKFIVGAGIRDGGDIKDSQFSLNWRGVEIANPGNNNTVSKIANSETYNNRNGLAAFQFNEDSDSSKVMIEDVTAKNNINGMSLTGTGITVNNVNTKNHNGVGLIIGFEVANEITLAGDVSIANNDGGFVVFPFAQGTAHVTGNLISTHNEYGVATYGPEFTLVVGGSNSGKSGKSGSGSLTACGNNVYDIDNAGGSAIPFGGPSTFVGSDYTCDTTDGADLPVCMPCYPGCSSSDSSTGSGHSLSAFVEGGLDLGHVEFPLL